MKKILLIVLAVVVAHRTCGPCSFTSSKSVTPSSDRQGWLKLDLSTVSVSGTGQIKAKTYVNLGATAMGRVTHLYVKEGDTVKKGETVATIEHVQQRHVEASRPPSPPPGPTLAPTLRGKDRSSQRRARPGRSGTEAS